jgi:hypothetical protein
MFTYTFMRRPLVINNMSLQLLHYEFPYIGKFDFFFQCGVLSVARIPAERAAGGGSGDF